ncbi:hypothetical protein [Weissella minor]|uniref:hypothetical protein n=1 Tax=Weissella minor TaxID=1620 RepID=UPI003AF2DF7D
MSEDKTIRIQRVPSEQIKELELIADEQGFSSIQDLLRVQIELLIENRAVQKLESLTSEFTDLQNTMSAGFNDVHTLIDSLNKNFESLIEEEY